MKGKIIYKNETRDRLLRIHVNAMKRGARPSTSMKNKKSNIQKGNKRKLNYCYWSEMIRQQIDDTFDLTTFEQALSRVLSGIIIIIF